MEFLIGVLAGGLLFYLFIDRKRPSGCFTIDLRDESKDVYTLNLYEDINDIYCKKHIMLEIKTFAENSPK